MNIQYVTLNADNEKCNGQDSLLEAERWKFDLPEADKCLLASGELEVKRLSLQPSYLTYCLDSYLR